MADGSMLIPIPVDDPLSMAWLDTNDLGNAERLVRVAKGLLLHVEGVGWVGYDGRRWSARDGEQRAARLAHDVARHIDREAAALHAIADSAEKLEKAFGWEVPVGVAQERVTALRKHAVKSGDTAKTAGMLTQARALLAARREEFDQDVLAFNVQNGTLRFVQAKGGGWSVRLDPHEPTDKIMQIAAVSFVAGAAYPEWEKRLELIQPDPGQRVLLQQLYGYALLGLRSEQKWFIHQGRGGDGKSLTNHVIGELFADYYRHADVKSFLKGAMKSGSDHSSDFARLSGDIRLVTFEEPPKNATWDSSRLKQVTGGRITCRALRMEEIEYTPRFVVMGEVNPLPAVDSDDDGFWRRCRVVPWPYQFDKAGEAAEPWDVVVGRLEAEASGILNWMIDGALAWLTSRRLPDSAPMKATLSEYRRSASPYGEWLEDRCELGDAKAETAIASLYNDFKDWCEQAGMEKVPTKNALARQLRDRQIREKKDRLGNRFRVGISLRPRDGGGLVGEQGGGWESDAAGPAGLPERRDGGLPDDGAFGGDGAFFEGDAP